MNCIYSYAAQINKKFFYKNRTPVKPVEIAENCRKIDRLGRKTVENR